MNSSPSCEERRLVHGRLRQQLDEEGLHVAVGLAPAERVELQGDRRVLGAQHAQLPAALPAPDDQRVAADLVVQERAQPDAEGPRDLDQRPQGGVDVLFLDQADEVGLEAGPLRRAPPASPLSCSMTALMRLPTFSVFT